MGLYSVHVMQTRTRQIEGDGQRNSDTIFEEIQSIEILERFMVME